jgi:3-hydroxyacyl-CoA dehydrogenase / enoyl-CoA hydratase / 3-hydroxybutyryl-CoA epimerase
MSSQNLKVTTGADGVALLAIDLAGRPMNVLTPALLEELAAAIEQLLGDQSVKGIVLTSAKDGAFVAGADIKDMVHAYECGISAAEAAEYTQPLHRLSRRLETGGKPVACAINGLALGGGLELALACHYRVLANDAKAVVGLPEVQIGLLPGGGGTQRLPRLIGIEKALPLLLTGRHVRPDEALQLGIVHALAEPAQMVDAARAWLAAQPSAVQPWDQKGYRVPGGAGPLAPHATRSFMAGTALTAQNSQRNYPAPLAILSCVYEGTQLSLDAGLRIEGKYFGRLLSGPVARNLMRTMFVNKGAADKLARRPKAPARTKVGRLGLLGAGLMGGGIAHVAAAAGIEVVLLDTTLEQAQKGRDYSARLLAKDLQKGKIGQDQLDARLARIKPTADYADLAGCDLVVEAVFENREIKAGVTRKTDAVIGSHAVFASNTSSLPITGLAQTFSRPADFIGLHFFSPVEKMPLVEVILGQQTSESTLARALDFVGQLRKTPIVVNDGYGFYTTRVFSTFAQEGQLMLDEGVAPALIENAARQAGMPVGPLAVSDEVTLELQLKGMEQRLADGIVLQPHQQRVLELVRRMVKQFKRIGRRGGAGFYDYPADGRKHLWSGLAQEFPLAATQPEVEELKQRLLCIQALEAARCFEEGVITDAADADLGSILGVGFPAWTGGALSFIDTVGIAQFVSMCEQLAARHGPRFAPSAWLIGRARRGEPWHPRAAQAA